jgi:hypothetical protein
VTDWGKDEANDAERDVAALLRAWLDGRQDDISAILDGAGDRGTRCITEVLLVTAAYLTARLTYAVLLIEDDQMQQAATITDPDTILANPDIRQAIEANLAGMQEGIVAGRIT